MTEDEWRNATDPILMVGALKGRSTDRKLRLYAVACCRLVRHLLPDAAWWEAVEVAERYSDGQASEQELILADETANTLSDALIDGVIDRPTRFAGLCVCETTRHNSRSPNRRAWECAAIALEGEWIREQTFLDANADVSVLLVEWIPRMQSERHEGNVIPEVAVPLVAALRDIFGNPFRPETFDPKWRTETAVALASGIYADRAFDRMPILADALEEAGCDDAEVLSHCRRPSSHVRGCWVVDLVLGKS